MPSATINTTIYIGGIEITGFLRRQATMHFGSDGIALPGGAAGALTTRTSATEGVATLQAGHGIEQDDVVSIFWEGGSRHGVVVDGVDGNAVSFGVVTPGAGDDLPAEETPLVMTVQVAVDVDVDGDLLEMIALRSDTRAIVEFLDGEGVSLLAVELAAGEPWFWVAGAGGANPLAGNPVGSIEAAAGTTEAAVLKIGGLYEAVS